MMLTENEVVQSLSSWLRNEQCDVARSRLGTSKGHDIEATKPDGTSVFVECKGSISPRTKKEFSMTYKWRCASGAVFNQLKLRADSAGAEIGIAFPDDPDYRELMSGLGDIFKFAKIKIYWVARDGRVSVEEIA